MEENALIKALRKAESERYTDLPSQSDAHDFSARFQKKMTRLICAQRLLGGKMTNTPARRAALLLLILLMTFGVRPDQNPLFRFAQQVPVIRTAAPEIQTDAAEPSAERPVRDNTADTPPYAAAKTAHGEPPQAVTEPVDTPEPVSAAQTENETSPASQTPGPTSYARRGEPASAAAVPQTTAAPANDGAATDEPSNEPSNEPSPGDMSWLDDVAPPSFYNPIPWSETEPEEVSPPEPRRVYDVSEEPPEDSSRVFQTDAVGVSALLGVPPTARDAEN